MKRVISLFTFVLAVLVIMPATVEAQYRRYDPMAAISGADCRYTAACGQRGGYRDYYDPYYRGGYDPYYDPRLNDPRFYDPCFGSDQHWQGMRGTMHAHEGKTHFRPCDPTNNRIGTVGGGALGAGGGALIGAVIGGRRGAAIGAVSGAATGGVLASRNNHDNCIVVGPTAQQGGGTPVSYQEQAPTPIQPIAGPATSGSGEGEFELSNSSRFRLEVYYDGKYLGRLGPDASLQVSYPEKSKKYTAHMLVPNEEGGTSSRPAKIVPGDAGLTFAEPEAVRGR